jgi:hypothetical protein
MHSALPLRGILALQPASAKFVLSPTPSCADPQLGAAFDGVPWRDVELAAASLHVVLRGVDRR